MAREARMPEDDYRTRYLKSAAYDRAVVKNLKPMLGPSGDNETAAQFLNGAVRRRAELFGNDVTSRSPSAGELLARTQSYVPPKPEPQKPQARGIVDRAKEAVSAARDLVSLVGSGYAEAVTIDPKSAAEASGVGNVVRQAGSLGIGSEGVGTVANGKFVGADGRVRDLTDADRAAMREQSRMTGTDRLEMKKIDPFGVMQASKGGNAPDLTGMSNFLATDRVPDTIFGIPVVSRKEDYTEADLAFFREHPEAGGYYDMGEGTPEDGTEEGAPVQAAGAGRARKPYSGSHNNPGNVKNFRFDWDGVDVVRSPVGGAKLLYFETPQAGLNAKAKTSAMILRDLASSGKTVSLENWARVYAPDSENDTEGYIRDLSSMTGFDRKAALDFSDDATAVKFMRAVVQRESGKDKADWFTEGEYKDAVRFLREKESFMTKLDRADLPRYNKWFRSLPKNFRWTEDYDLPGVWLEKLNKPDKYVPTQNGHMTDYGKKPNHITFSDESKWHDPTIPERTGGHWELSAGDNPRFWPGPGNKATNEELESYFEKREPDYDVMPKEDYYKRFPAKAGKGGK